MFVQMIPSRELTVGATIIEVPANGRKPVRIEVKRVDLARCSKYDTHVNSSWCYDREAPVIVEVAAPSIVVSPDNKTLRALREYEAEYFSHYPSVLEQVAQIDRQNQFEIMVNRVEKEQENVELEFARKLRDAMLGAWV